MRLHLTTIVVVLIVIGGAAIVGRVMQVIDLRDNKSDPLSDDLEGLPFEKSKSNSDSVIIGNSTNFLLWFMQISDLHISKFYDEERTTNLEVFTNETVAIVKPSVVLASGDLTDAKTIDKLGSRQYLEEWITYGNILNRSKIQEKTVWLDIRGNHDNFDVPSLSSSNNFYQKFSIQGQKNPRSYMHSVRKNGLTVSFIAVDACLLPGPRRPFNFIGALPNKEMKLLQSFEEESRHHNHTIWFGHYPTSCIIAPNPGIRKVMERGLAYMCGHLHTLGGLLRNMYTKQKTGFLELELADWKDERTFRVAAIDHGLFSFVDVRLNTWPIILITNPKDASFAMPENEPLHRISTSTHIRALVWSSSKIVGVKVRIDGRKWHWMTHVDGPLHVFPWKPLKYADGTHTIEVMAEDVNRRKNAAFHSFVLDGALSNFSVLAKIILMSKVSAIFQFLFGSCLFVYVVPLCIIRLVHRRVQAKKMQRPKIKSWFFRIWLRKFWILSCVDKFFWPFIIYAIYLPIGPWFIGEVLDNHIGVVFAWGTIVYGSFLPGSFTFAYGFLQVVLFQYPLLFITAHSADVRFQELFLGRKRSRLQFAWRHFSYFCLIAMQAMNAYFFWLAYGTMALILGPLRTWSVFLGIYMWVFSSSNLKKKHLRGVGEVWSRSSVESSTGSICGSLNGSSLLKMMPRCSSPKKRKNSDGEQES